MKFFFALKNLLLLFLPFFAFCQQNLDSLSYKELRIAFFKDYSKDNNQIKYAKYYFEKAKKEQNDLEKGRSYYLLAYSVYYNDLNLSLSYFEKYEIAKLKKGKIYGGTGTTNGDPDTTTDTSRKCSTKPGCPVDPNPDPIDPIDPDTF
ncbi:hypothetical protein [Flavobacterium sp. J27]|uniref:hypothetical protein n=1 Tax=Flavobacterium sp. J27 TaxID=2060419 RepID=UPI0010319BF9|nr:hypothetical protein [Flavobacterium sp. J27]